VRLWCVFSLCLTGCLIAPRFKNQTFSAHSDWGSARTMEDASAQRGDYGALVPEPKQGAHLGSEEMPDRVPLVHRKYGSKKSRLNFVEVPDSEGSLWSSTGQVNYYFTKNPTRAVGDLIAMVVQAPLYKDIIQEVKRSLSPFERMSELTQLREKAREKVDQASKGPVPLPTPSLVQEAVKLGGKLLFEDVDLVGTLELKESDVMMGEVLERFPNGNYRVRFHKRIPYRNGLARKVMITGVVKGLDIQEEMENFPSGRMYEYRVDIAI
jgi:hypothetical protein